MTVSPFSVVSRLPLREPVGLHRVSVLVVEDAPDVLDVFTTLLRLEGAHVVGVANGADALAASRRHRFDVAIVDLGLPDIPGEVLIRAIKGATWRPLTVVVITGERGASVSRARDAGASAIFVKPCDWAHVLAYLNGLNLVAAA
jgi:DNA-binding response OmpR family regulator